MNYRSFLLLGFVLFLFLTAPLVAQELADNSSSVRELDQKLDLILRRLDAIEKRLAQLEAAQGDFDAANRLQTPAIPDSNPFIRWCSPVESKIYPSVDSGMLIDGIERNLNRKDRTLLRFVPNAFK